MRQRGFMVAIEGIDGSGKSGVATYLADELRSAGYEVLRTQEPGGTQEGAILRKLLLARDGFDWTPTAELLLMNASRRQHVERVIAPALQAGKVVVCDRFVGSTVAYQGAGRGLADEVIFGIHRLAIDDFWPDLTLVLDLEPAVGLRRSRRRLEQSQVDEGRFETLDITFHERVRQSFLAQAANLPVRYDVIDANRSSEVVQQHALQCVLSALKDTGR